ncbi:MAG: protein-L-isoaspartate(D-aspartate) O-methyltransferase [Candidatus Omnitrophota bacterium]
MNNQEFNRLRELMVNEQLIPRGISNQMVLSAFRSVQRELFVPDDQKSYAYHDRPLPIGFNQTISQPYIVALMSESLSVNKGDRILEIGTGSGYQSAILAYLGARVYSVERFDELAGAAKICLASLDFHVDIKVGDGSLGWLENAPFDKIIVTAAAKCIPEPLLEQLKVGGRIIIPLGGSFSQDLSVIDKITRDKTERKNICGCIFVPLVGKYGYKEN